jgi:hypothetical protein
MRQTRVFLAVLFALLLGGCSSVRIGQYAGTEPQLDLFEYFEGSTRAWGMFQGRDGSLKRRFVVDIRGVVEGDLLTLTEDFQYADGEKQKRVWRIRRLDAQRYSGTAGDVIGEALGEARGAVFNWRYTLRLPYGEGTVDVRFDDWMFLQPDGVLLNRARVEKFGFTVGEVTLAFRKEG